MCILASGEIPSSCLVVFFWAVLYATENPSDEAFV